MLKRKLRQIEVSPIGMGCMGFSHGYGEIPTEDYSIAAIRKAFDFGCTFFDTAEAYGPNLLLENRGHNERLVGKALREVRDRAVLATKLHLNTEEVTAKGLDAVVREHLAQSLGSKKISVSDLYSAARGSDKPIFIDRREAIQQRAATVLRDVSYVVEANFRLIPEKMNADDREEKFYAIFCNRARRGRCFTQPYFGCREFPASFELIEENSIQPQPISESRDLGIMLFDMDFSDTHNIKPMFFHAEMVNGVVEVEGKEVLR